MMKQLAEWCDKNQNGFIPPAQRLAEEMDEECNGKVTNISYPKLDHFLQESVTFPKFLPFFDEHTNDIEPDFDIIRAAAKKWLK